MLAPIWLSVTMLAYCLWVIIHDISSNWSEPVYGSILTIGVWIFMNISMQYPPALCVIVEIAAVSSFIYHIVNNRR